MINGFLKKSKNSGNLILNIPVAPKAGDVITVQGYGRAFVQAITTDIIKLNFHSPAASLGRTGWPLKYVVFGTN